MTRLSDYAHSISTKNIERYKIIEDIHSMTNEMRKLVHDTLMEFRVDGDNECRIMSPNMQVRVIDELLRMTGTPYLAIKEIIETKEIETEVEFYYVFNDGRFYTEEELWDKSDGFNKLMPYDNCGVLKFKVDDKIIDKLKSIL